MWIQMYMVTEDAPQSETSQFSECSFGKMIREACD